MTIEKPSPVLVELHSAYIVVSALFLFHVGKDTRVQNFQELLC